MRTDSLTCRSSVSRRSARERTDLRLGIQRVADTQRLDLGSEAPLEVARDGLDGDEALGRDTRLSVVLVSRPSADLRRGVEIRVGEHDVWVGAAELQHAFL